MSNNDACMIIDTGTGNLRVAVAANDGTILAIARENVHYEKDDLYPESIGFNPKELWKQIIRLAGKVVKEASGVTIGAVTATSQREGIVLTDDRGEALAGLPNIDHRGREWEHLLQNKSRVYQLTGRYPTSLFSAFKLVGMRERRPEIWRRTHRFMSISDWVEFHLSGVAHYEHSQASETLLYDVEAGSWSDELCGFFQLSSGLLPPLYSSGSIVGNVLPGRAAELGISPEAQVVVGGGDTQLAVRSTCPSTDDIVIVSGTTTPIVKLTGGYVTDALERTWTNRHITETDFILEANAGVTGLNYQRLKEIFYPNEGYDVIEAELARADHSQCIASLGSLVASEKSPLTKGGFIFDAPVSHRLSRSSFVFATLWDIACSIKENYTILCEVNGHQQDHIWACGGGVQSRTLRSFIAGLLNKEIRIRDNYRQASVVGGVFTCNQALGIRASEPTIAESIKPSRQEYYEELYQTWKKTRSNFKQFYRDAS